MIAPTFHINILKSFMTIFNQKSVNIVNNMKSEMGKTFDVHDYMGRATVDILLGKCVCFMIEKYNFVLLVLLIFLLL